MNSRYRWERNRFPNGRYAGWYLFDSQNDEHLGTVFVDGSWYCVVPYAGVTAEYGSQPLAAQALLRAAGVDP